MAKDDRGVDEQALSEVSFPRVVRIDPASGGVLLVGATHGLTLMLCCLVPLVVGLMFAAQLAFDLWPWPVGNYELTLLVWMALWLGFLLYNLGWGSYVETYLISPQQRWLWHLNSGEMVDLTTLAERARTRQAPDEAATFDLSLAESLLLLDEQQLRALPPYQTSPLRAYLRGFWSPDAWKLAGLVVGILLLIILLVVGSLGGVFLAVWVLAVAWLASALAAFCLQHQAPRRAEALLRGRSIEDVVRNEA